MSRLQLVLGTFNRKKGQELIELLEPLGLDLKLLGDVRAPLVIEEDGDSFAANARKKASQQAVHLGAWVLGEDSGLCVDALHGRPGIFSARFSGPDATDESNNAHLLRELGNTPLERRGAHYVCHAALARPTGEIVAEATGSCHGRIRFEPAGTAGFGYDPLFEILEYHRTFGQLGPAAKACLSHRARAIAQLIPRIRQLIGSGEWTVP
jgi:XTP/dITP diphosphohydrolase